MTATQPEPVTLSGIFASRDASTLAELYWGVARHTGGDIKLAPEHKFGGGDWRAAARENLSSPEFNDAGLLEPANWEEALRWCVLVDTIEACAPETALLVYFSPSLGDEPAIRFLSGPKEDEHIAKLIVGRELGFKPRMVPSIVSDVEPPLPANDNDPEPAPPAMHLAPFTPEAAGGLLGQIAQWVTDTAIVPVPELSLASAIAVLAGLFGKKALTPTEAGVNVYITTLLDTAGGKGHPPKAIRRLVGSLGAAGKSAVTNGDHTSYAAIERTLRLSSSTAIVMDEFGLTLQDINAKHQNSVAASIRKFLLAVYDQANSLFDGRIYASAETKKDAEPIIGPALTVLGMTTVETLYAGLSQASVADGFLNRFVFVTAGRADEVRPPGLQRENKLPVHLVEALKAALSEFPKGGGLLQIPKYTVPMAGGEDGDAYSLWSDIFRWQNNPFWHGDARNIIGRAAENTIRLATLRAISRRPSEPEVDRADIEWAWGVVFASIRTIRQGVRRHLAESPADRLRKDIVAAIEDSGGGLTYSKLLERKGVRGADHRQLADALSWLIASGAVIDINARPTPGKGSKLVLAV